MEIGRIEPKKIRVEIGDVYERTDSFGDTDDLFEIIDINNITRAVTIYRERYNTETILPIQNFVDLISKPETRKTGKMIEEKKLFFFKKKVFKEIYEV
mgnify:CR=1 FL=1